MEPYERGRAMFGENAERLPLNNPSAALEAFRVVKTGDGWLFGFTVTNTKGSDQFVLMFDDRDLPAEGAVPLFGAKVTTGDARGFIWIPPRRFEAGLVLCNSSTQGSKTLGSADCLFDAQYV